MLFEFVIRKTSVYPSFKTIINSLLINIKNGKEISYLFKKIGRFFSGRFFFFFQELSILIHKKLIRGQRANPLYSSFKKRELVFILPQLKVLLNFKKKVNNSKFTKEALCQGNIRQIPKKIMQVYQSEFKKKVKIGKKKKIENLSNIRLKTLNKQIFLKIFQINLAFYGKSVKDLDFWKKILFTTNSSLKNLGEKNLKNF